MKRGDVEDGDDDTFVEKRGDWKENDDDDDDDDELTLAAIKGSAPFNNKKRSISVSPLFSQVQKKAVCPHYPHWKKTKENKKRHDDY